MTLHPTFWALLPLAAVAAAVAVGRHVWAQRREPGAWALLALGAAAGWWALLQLLVLTVGSAETQVVLSKVQYLGIAGAPLFWFLFSVAYTGRGGHLRGPLGLVTLVPLATVVLAFTNESHGLVWSSVARAAAAPGLAFEHGPWFWVNAAWSYVLVAAATGVLVWHHAQSPRGRARVLTVVAAPLAVLLPHALYLSPMQPDAVIDLTPTGFVLANAVLAWGLLRHGLLVMAPVARTIVVEEMRDAVLVLDRRGRIVDLNRAALDVLELEPEGPLPVPLGTAWAQAARKDGMVVTDATRVRLSVAGEGERPFELTMTPLGPRGGRGSTVLVLRDITDRERMERALLEKEAALREANEELERLVNTDALTGLANRRRFMAALDTEIERAQRYGRRFAVIFLDLDHFKRVNDSHGHAAGDEVLRVTGEVLREVSRDIDLAARLGGEEMAVLLPETGPEGAAAMAERLRHGVARKRFMSPSGTAFSVTTSAGVAVFEPGMGGAEALLHAADEALYVAKEAGRNRVVVARGPDGPEAAAV